MEKKMIFGQTKAVNAEKRTIDLIANDYTKDRDGDLLIHGCFDESLPEFLKKGVILAAHAWFDYAPPPVIGKPRAVRSVKEGLTASIEFASKEANPLAENYWLLYRDEFMSMFSVGFKAKKVVWTNRITEDDTKEINMRLGRYGMTMKDLDLVGVERLVIEAELLEISCVPIPSNAGAQALRSYGADAEKYMVPSSAKSEAFELTAKGFDFLVSKVAKPSDTVDKESKAAVRFSAHGQLGVLPEDRPWDSGLAEARIRAWASSDGSGNKETMDWAKYRKGFAWFDSSKEEEFGSYKLPHHDISGGKLVHHWRGSASAMGVLLGAMGGVDIPDADRRGVYDHLVAEYHMFDKQPPDYAEKGAAKAPETVLSTEFIEKLADMVTERVVKQMKLSHERETLGSDEVKTITELKELSEAVSDLRRLFKTEVEGGTK